MPDMRITCGLDIGNGYVKGRATVNGASQYFLDAPSVVAYTVPSAIKTKLAPSVFDHFENVLEATIVSPCIKSMDDGNVIFGKRALEGKNMVRGFNIDDKEPKCESSLSGFLVLGSVASVAIEHVYKTEKKIPEEMTVHVCAALAIPIEDYDRYQNVYKERLEGVTHVVNVRNFDHPVTVNIRFDGVVVLPEGAAAQYAISRLDEKFLDAAVADSRAHGVPIDPEVTGVMLIEAKNTIGVDIGEGTTNFPVYTNGNVNINASASINYGWGSVLEAVVDETRNLAFGFENRKALADFLEEPQTTPSRRAIVQSLEPYIDAQARVLTQEIGAEFARVFRVAGKRTDATYVYGGGASKVQKYLFPVLSNYSMIGDIAVPVIYFDSSYSRQLNRNGLYDAAVNYQKRLGWV